MKFLFDLDGTVTSEETLPIIASIGGLEKQITELTNDTVRGTVPCIESFIKRVNLLRNISVSMISSRLSDVKIYPQIYEFIQQHPKECAIVTGNLSCWLEGFNKKFDCDIYTSKALVENDKVVKIESILLKEKVVDKYHAAGEKVVFIGDGNNDLEAMRCADISIAVGMTHSPAMSLLDICDYVIYNEKTLCRQLNQLL